MTGRPPPQNVNVCLNYIPGKGVVLRTDSQQSIKLDETTLEADHFFKIQDINPSLKGFMAAAHGHYDSDKGEFINFTYTFGGPRVEYHVFKIGQTGKPETLCRFWDTPRYVHSFATTENYVVMILYPLTILWWKIYFHQSVMAGLHFDKNSKAKFVVISRSEKEIVAVYESSPMFAFHTINAYETEDDIVIDLSHYEDGSIVHNFDVRILCKGLEIAKNSLVRVSLKNFMIAKRSGVRKPYPVQMEMLNHHMLELPSINPSKERKRHRYVYGVSTSENRYHFGTVSKVDVDTGKRITKGFKYGMVSEPVFVPDPNGVQEDDGCILVVVLDTRIQRSIMFVLDAKDLGVVASADVPQAVPQGFHSMFRRQ
ncbi:Carotenoid oxygenase [Gracilaria domingensis]|nr:Carotenoid oxygenase [Gracilaria domingensis]